MDQRQLSYEEYTIGWVCALSLEQTAAMYMLDERHQKLRNSKHDHNAYTLGRIGKHNVVIAGLPYGRADNNNAATLAAQMLSTFPNIRMTLMVGVGGGIPQKTRLGDVVICSPSDTNAGVIQWDKGKEEINGFKRQGCLTGPPRAGLTALSSFQADPENPQKMSSYLDGIDKRFFNSESLEDILFEAEYDHVGDTIDCSGCDKKRILRRGPAIYPTVHYGLIVSGNRKIKDARFRDKLYQDYNKNLFCIEMEAAGLMDDFHCVVIRGICDYADSHANDKWQNYAAAVAAACAKTYLGVVQEYESHRPQSVQASFASDNARHSRENENSRENDMQYHTPDSPPLTPKKFEGVATSAPRMIGWRGTAYSKFGEPQYDDNDLIRPLGEAFTNFLQGGSRQAHVTKEEIKPPQTPPRSPKRNNPGHPRQPEDDLPHTNSDPVPSQPSNLSDLRMIAKENRVHTFPNTDPAIFFEAIEKGDVATIKRELKNGTNLEIVDEFGRTPLWHAVLIGKRSVVQLLLEKGASIEAKNFHGQNILGWAVEKQKNDIIEMLGYS